MGVFNLYGSFKPILSTQMVMAETQNCLVHIGLAWITMVFAMGGSLPVKKRL